MMDYELVIQTNDGWAVTLIADREFNLGDVVLKSIIVQPRADLLARVEREPDTPRGLYRLNQAGPDPLT